MRRGRRWLAPVCRVLACASGLWLAATAPAPAQDADSLLERGRALARSPQLELKLQAARDLAEAARLEPGNAAVWRELSALQASLRQRDQAGRSLEHLAKLTPDDARAWSRLGDAWRWDWLATVDDSSFARALRCYRRATGIDPAQLDAWLGRAGMALAKGDLRGSRAAAEGAIACAPTAATSQLAFACVAYRAGALDLAEGAFDVAIPRLPAEFVPRFHGVPAAQSRSTVADTAGVQDSTLVWSDETGIPDPDLTTPANEAALDFQFRVGLALLLLRSEDSLRWDMRSELIARYGLPSAIDEARPDQVLEFQYARRLSIDESIPSVKVGPPYYFHFQLWRYPALGMDVPLWDRSQHEQYENPTSLDVPVEPSPDPRRVVGHSDLMLARGGVAVFRTMAPGVTPFPVLALVSRFPAPSGTRLVAHVGAAAGSQDTLWARMVVSDAAGHPVASAEGRLRRSLCAPAERQLAQLASVVPAGTYRIDISVRRDVQHRGLVRMRAIVPEPESPLRMGDLVMLCGPVQLQATGPAVQLDPEFGRRTTGASDVAVYFELANLVADAAGVKSFSYSYVIHALDDDGSEVGPALVQATRSEQYTGDNRRQVITAKCGILRPGHYRLRIDVRDDHGGTAAARMLDFEKAPDAAESPKPPSGR